MRRSALLIAGLLGACIAAPARLTMEVSYGDLQLGKHKGRATFRQHVVQAARGYCDEYGAEMPPHAARADPLYCLDMFRSWIIGEMSPEVRRAYFQARREAAVRGRQLCRRELACESASGEETGVGRGTAPQLMRCRIAHGVECALISAAQPAYRRSRN